TVVSMHGGPVDAEEWYEQRAQSGSYHHYGTTVGHGALRSAAGVTDPYAPGYTRATGFDDRDGAASS
ncbi:MAG: hypothetical protein HN899_08650, partial [Gemmatimonadales bacterium]|nr:hypothetical protein [Gemmatimonadales bacterium]